MTNEEFISLIKSPDQVKPEHVPDLKELVDLYPGFVQARILYVKALQQSHNINFHANLKLATLYTTNRRWLYYYIHPEKKIVSEPYRRESNGKSAGNYFDMLQVIEKEGGDTKKSLKNLAERLKSARSMVVGEPVKPEPKIEKPLVEVVPEVKKTINVTQPVIEPKIQVASYFDAIEEDISESNAKNLIRNKKYSEAIEILRKLNLNNPKKSVYFADQIRFLEKIIANSKK